MGAFIQDANILAPYADMLNHSPNANCFLHWRFKDRMLEVMIKAGHAIKKGDEMTIDYMSGVNSKFMERYGFSSPTVWACTCILLPLLFVYKDAGKFF